MVRFLSKNANNPKPLLLVIAFLWGACAKDPVWLPEFKALLENMNHEVEAVLPLVNQSTSPENFYIGLRRFDKASDQIVTDLGAFLDKYPHILTEKITIGFHLRKQLDQLGKNLKLAFVAGNAWGKKIGHEKEFKKLAGSIDKKIRKVNALLKAALEPD